jgi:ribonucleoside-diphosphate reductase beta chain
MYMLFQEQISRKPDLYPWTKDFIEAIWSGFWTPEEFNFTSDYSQFKTEMSDGERQILVRTLSAIGQIEVAVKTFWSNLGDNLPHPSLRDLGYAMGNSEVIHNMAYEKLLDVLQLNDVFEENLKDPVIAGRVDYLRKYLKKVYKDDRKQYIYAITLFTIFVENVSLFSQFYIILHMNKNKAILKDTAQQVKYTRNEEMLHAQVGIKIINTMREEYPDLFDDEMQQRITEECMESIRCESEVIRWIMDGYEVDGLSSDILIEFIKKRMIESLGQIGFEHNITYDEQLVKETKWFDEGLYGTNMVDFFNGRPVDYARGQGVSADDLF